MKELLLVGFGGFIGSIARYIISMLNHRWETISLPIGTLIVNVSGSFAMGMLMALADKKGIISSDMRLFLMVGICGGFTTFSAFTSENLKLLMNGEFFTALFYILTSVLLGLLAIWLGFKLIVNY